MDQCACKQQKVDIAEDRISHLPESILSRILSCLVTEEAVRTSVLSRRWKHMWTSIIVLRFDDSLVFSLNGTTRKEYFMNFVERVLLHLDSLTISTFILNCDDHSFESSPVNAWISTVLRHHIPKLDIYCMVDDFLIPSSINNCNSLVELKLETYGTLKVNTCLHLSKLKILDLTNVKILNESFPHSSQLLLSFPVLEIFSACLCTWLNAKTIIIDAPSLESFEMSSSRYEGIPDCSPNCAIEVLAPCLTKFVYSGYLLEEFILPSPSSVLHATIDLSLWGRNTDQVHETGLRAYMLLRHFSCLNHLTLAGETIKALAHAKDLVAVTDLPTFNKLICLELNSRIIVSETMMNFLHMLPMLESLIIRVISSCDDDVFALPKVPHCFLSHLKVVQLQSFRGSEHELSFVKYLLENAMVLEELTITNSSFRYEELEEGKMQLVWSEELENGKMQVLAFPKGSSQARIVFSDPWTSIKASTLLGTNFGRCLDEQIIE